MFKDSIKSYTGIELDKAVDPAETFRCAMSKHRNLQEPVLGHYHRFWGLFGYSFFSGARLFRLTASTPGAYGKGHSAKQAKASGIMEFSERYSTYHYLRSSSKRVARLEDLPGNRFDLEELFRNKTWEKTRKRTTPTTDDLSDMELSWFLAHSLSGTDIHIPFGLVRTLSGSDGMAAGNSLEEALVQAICEVIERHCQTLVFGDQRKVPEVSLESLSNDWLRERIERLNRGSSEPLRAIDCSLGLGIPVIGVCRFLSTDTCLITLGAATSRDEALARALSENRQVQSNKTLHVTRAVWDQCCATECARVDYDDIPELYDRNFRTEIYKLSELLKQHGMDVYFADTTHPQLDIPAVWVYISHARCSLAAVLWNEPLPGSYSSVELALFRECLANGDLDNARLYLPTNEDDFQYYYQRGIYHLKAHEIECADDFFREALRITTSDGWLDRNLLSLSATNYLTGDIDGATRRFHTLAARHTGSLVFEWLYDVLGDELYDQVEGFFAGLAERLPHLHPLKTPTAMHTE